MNSQTQITLARLERMEQIAQDTRKRFVYDKSSGKWGWLDSDEDYYTECLRFDSRFEALMDAVEPYMNVESDESE